MIKVDPDKLLACFSHLSQNAVQINSIISEINSEMPILFPSFSGPQRYRVEMEEVVADLKRAALLFDEISREGIAAVEASKDSEEMR